MLRSSSILKHASYVQDVPPSFLAVVIALAATTSAPLRAVPASPIHLAVRTDDHDGVGTYRDPRDASTAQKLDSMWPGLPAGAHIRFGQGVFVTRTGLKLKPGQRVKGRGPNRSTLRLADGSMPAGIYPADAPLQLTLLRSDSLDGDNHVASLGLDGNRNGQPAYVENSTHSFLGAIALYGMDSSIRNVQFVNGFSRSDQEAFPIIIEGHRGTFQRPARGRIEHVAVDEPDGYNTAISLLAQTRGGSDVSASASTGVFTTATRHTFAQGDEVIFVRCQGNAGIEEGRPYFVRDVTPTTFRVGVMSGGPSVQLRADLTAATAIQPRRITGVIRDCIVRGRTDGGYSKTIGFGCGGWLRVALRGNRTEGVGIGINTDTHCYRDVRIENNYFSVRADPHGYQSFGVFLGGGYSWTRYVIRGNTFELSRNAAALVLNGNVRDVLLVRNKLLLSPDGVGGSESVSLRGEGNSGVRLVRNWIDPRLRFSDQPGVVTARIRNRALAVPKESQHR